MFLMMMVSSVVLFENFGASYTSFLSVVTQSKPFDSVEELYTKTEYKIGDKGGTNQKINFKVLTFLTFPRYFTLTQYTNMPYSEKLVEERWDDTDGIVAGIEKMNNQPYAMIISTQEMLFKLMEREQSCDFVIVGPILFYGNMIMAWPKNFAFGPLFDY